MYDVDKRNEAYKRWYDAHRDEFNALRRDRYKRDPILRKKAQAQARTYRNSGPYDPGGPRVVQVGHSKVTLYSTSQVACRLGVSTQVLRKWEASRYIPMVDREGSHRVYRSHQIRLIEKLVTVVNRYRQSSKILFEKREEVVKFIWLRW